MTINLKRNPLMRHLTGVPFNWTQLGQDESIRFFSDNGGEGGDPYSKVWPPSATVCKKQEGRYSP